MGILSRTTKPSQSGGEGRRPSRASGRNADAALLRRAQAAPASLRPADVHSIQRAVGNRATGALLGGLPIQAKLEVGPVNDVHEKEADRVAREVVRRTSTPQAVEANAAAGLQRAPLAAEISGVQRQEEDELAMKRDTLQRQEEDELAMKRDTLQRQEEDELAMKRDTLQRQEEDELAMKRDTLQRQEEDELAMKRDTLQRQEEDELAMKRERDPSYRDGGSLDGGLEKSIRQAKGGGKALDRGVMRQMESGFGASFGGVRIHTDANADKLTRSVQAKAFTTGKDIFGSSGIHVVPLRNDLM